MTGLFWNGEELTSPGAIVRVLGEIARADPEAQKDGADLLRAAWEHCYPEHSFDDQIGYLTGELPADEGRTVRAVLDVQHPYGRELFDDPTATPMDLFTLGERITLHKGDDEFPSDAAITKAHDDVRALRAFKDLERL